MKGTVAEGTLTRDEGRVDLLEALQGPQGHHRKDLKYNNHAFKSLTPRLVLNGYAAAFPAIFENIPRTGERSTVDDLTGMRMDGGDAR